MTRRTANLGLTLMEMVLAISLAVGLLGGTMAFYHRTAEVRDGLTSQMQAIEGQRLVMDRLTSELRSAMAYPFLGIGMEGGTDHMTFVAPQIVGPRAYGTWPEGIDKGGSLPRHDLELVTYRLRAWEDDEGNVHIDGLERVSQPAQMSQPQVDIEPVTRQIISDGLLVEVDESPLVEPLLIMPEARFFAIRYYDKALAEEGGLIDSPWIESWSGGDLPLAVEVIVGLMPIPEGMMLEDYVETYQPARRVVFLPGCGEAMAGPAQQETPP